MAMMGATPHIAHFADPSLKHPFWIMEWEEVWNIHVLTCSLVLFLGGILCSAAGIGGGGVYVAVLMILGELSPHNAVPLSKAVVFFGAIASLAANMRRMWSPSGQQEGASRTVINFHACRVTVPAALVGTFLGVALNWHARGHTIVVLLTGVLSFMTLMVCRTAWRQRCEEEQGLAMKGHHIEAEAPKEEQLELLPQNAAAAAAGGSYNAVDGTAELWAPPSTKAASKKPEKLDACSTEDIVMAGLLLFIVVASGVFRFHMHACAAEQSGNGAAGSCQHPLLHHTFGGRMEVWMSDPTTAILLQRLVTSLPLWSCVFMSVYSGHLVHKAADWRMMDILSYQVMAVSTGLLAGLVGVGGGLIFSPFFLVMGMDPSVAVATSSTCVLFTSSSTTIQYLFTDRVIMSLALVYGLVCCAASWLGTSLVHELQDTFHGRRSYITLIVAAAVGLSAILSLGKFVRMMAETGAAT